MMGELHESFVIEGDWGRERTWQRKIDRRHYFLLRRGKMMEHILVVGMLPLQNIGIVITEA